MSKNSIVFLWRKKKKGCFKIEGWRWELKDLLGLREATCLNDKPKASGVKLFFSIEEWLWGKENKQRKHMVKYIYVRVCMYAIEKNIDMVIVVSHIDVL